MKKQELVKQAIELLETIDDNEHKLDSIIKILPFMEDDLDYNPAGEFTPAPAPAKARKPRTPKAVKEEPVAAAAETSKSFEDSCKTLDEAMAEGDAEPADKSEPITEETVEAIAEELAEDIVVPVPKEVETDAETQRRVTMFIKKYGDKALSDVFNDDELLSLVAPEVNSVSDFNTLLHSSLDEYAEAEDVTNLLHFYISEAQEGVKTYTDVTMDKFLTVYLPYQKTLTSIYKNDLDTIVKAIKEISNNTVGNDPNVLPVGFISIYNSTAILDVINALKAEAI